MGTVLFIVKLLSFNVSPLVILFYQYIGSLISAFSFLRIKKVSFGIKKRNLLMVLLSGVLVSTGLSFYYLAIGLTTASRVVPIHNVGITLVPAILAFLFLKEKITKRVVIGLIASIICIILLTL
jgi:uncharacterized membrane protein